LSETITPWPSRVCRYKSPPSRLRPHFVKAKVRVHQYCDGAVASWIQPSTGLTLIIAASRRLGIATAEILVAELSGKIAYLQDHQFRSPQGP
jgi:hypothetical protein